MLKVILSAALTAAVLLYTTRASAENITPYGFAAERTFVLARQSNPNDVTVKWAQAQYRIEHELAEIDRCKLDCPPSVDTFRGILAAAHEQNGWNQVLEVNRQVNISTTYMPDILQYGVDDYWATALEVLRSHNGDCEDYAIAKYELLVELGMPREALRLIVVQNGKEEHMVLALLQAGSWFILDNRTLNVLDDHARSNASVTSPGSSSFRTAASGNTN